MKKKAHGQPCEHGVLRSSDCGKCLAAKARRWQAANPEKVKTYQNRYVAKRMQTKVAAAYRIMQTGK
jgi:hypothetical protein